MMGGIVGRLFREFAVTLSMAIGVSLVISLTTTPTMCAKFLRPPKNEKHNRFYRASEWVFEGLLAATRDSSGCWRISRSTLDGDDPGRVPERVSLHHVPKGFFPQQDTGRIMGAVMGSQDISFQAMSAKMKQYVGIVMKDPAVESVVGFAGETPRRIKDVSS